MISTLDVIARVRREPPFASPDDPFPDTRYLCKVIDPVPWDRCKIEHELGLEIPSNLSLLWDHCGGLLLYEDDKFRQWGLVVLSPLAVVEHNLRYRMDRDHDATVGDLVFARFRGDRELGMIRCDKAAADCGSIIIVAEMDSRPDWYTAARTLEEFLMGFMDAHGEKYWEYHYQKRLAERATQDLTRSRGLN